MSRQKRIKRQYSEKFKQDTVARMAAAASISGLARELGLQRSLLYEWERALAGNPRRKGSGKTEEGESRRPAEVDNDLRSKIRWLEEALARQMAERDFFRGALQKIEARRQSKEGSGGTASTGKSGR